MDEQARARWFHGRLETHRMEEVGLKILGWALIAIGIALGVVQFLEIFPEDGINSFSPMIVLLLAVVTMLQARAHRLAREELQGLYDMLRGMAPGDGEPGDHNS